MIRSAGTTIRKFNPGTFQSDQELIAQFVVRDPELGILLEVLRGNIQSASCQHVLVVGPRGRGKTMLLARTAAEMRTNDALSNRLFPVRFMEESQEIFNMTDFWLETLFHLAREISSSDSELAWQLRQTHAVLAGRWREATLGEAARAAVLEAADRLDRRLVLMVENLQSLTQDVDRDFGWKLRGVLQSEPQIILLGSATSHFRGLNDASHPFFELFRIIDLEPLRTEECRRLWQVVSGDTVSGREVRPLEILTGGSPRLLVIVAGFSRHRSLRQLMEDMVTLIDDHTEYFRGHLNALAKTERRVYLAVLDLWRPSSAGEVAARARMDIRTVSALLGRLVNRGVVTREGRGRKRRYAAAERLYSIYFKLRRERDDVVIVRDLIHFMVAFYGIGELYEMSARLTSEVAESAAFRKGFARALSDRPPGEDGVSGTKWDAIQLVSDQATARYWSMAEWCIEKEINTALTEKSFERVVEIVDGFAASLETGPDRSQERIIDYLLYMKACALHNLADYRGVIAVCTEMVDRFGDSGNVTRLVRLAEALVLGARARFEIGEYGAAIATCEDVIRRFGNIERPPFQEAIVAALVEKGSAQEELGDFEAAVAAYDEAVERLGDSGEIEVQVPVASVSLKKGNALVRCGNPAGSIAVYDEVIERFADCDDIELQRSVAVALIGKGARLGQLGEHGREIAAYGEVLDRFDDGPSGIRTHVAIALSLRGMRLAETGRAEEALQDCEELEREFCTLEGDGINWFKLHAMCVRTMARMVQKRRRAAMDAFISVYAAFTPCNEVAMQAMLRVVPTLIATGARVHELVEIMTVDKAKSDAMAPLVVALRQHAGEKVRAPVEVLEVATDIRDRIRKRMGTSASKSC